MVDRGTIRPSEEVFNRLNEERQELGLTWDQYLDRDDSNTGKESWREGIEEAIRATDPVDYGHIREVVREVVREETRGAIEEARR